MRARRALVDWYLSLFVMCKAWHQYNERLKALALLNSPLISLIMLNRSQSTTAYNKTYILGQKRNAAYKTYIYGGISLISQKRCVDFWIMSSWDCPSYHCHRTKLIHQFKPTSLSILTSQPLGDGVLNTHGLTLFQFVRNVT